MARQLKQLDLSQLTPEARPIVAVAADVYLRHTRRWLVGLLAHGSAVKGGFIPGCSDIDLQLYLGKTAFTEEGALPLDLCLAIQRDLSAINPAPFAYVQCYAYPCRLPADQVGPIPGAYLVLAGRLPVPEATAAELTHKARETLASLGPVARGVSASLLQYGDGKLERQVRLLCTDVWPALYSHLVLHLPDLDPRAIWQLRKEQAIALVPASEEAGQQIRAFHAALWRYYPARQTIPDALAAMEHGIAFLHAVRAP